MRTLITTITLLLITVISYGQIISPTNVVNTLPTPLQFTGGVTSINGYLWTTNLNNIITKLSPADGQVINTLYVDESGGNKRFFGISFDGTHLWAIEMDYRTLYQIDTINGTIINQFQLNNDYNNHPYHVRDISFESGFIWYSLDFIGTVDTIYKCDTNGNILYKKALRQLSPNNVNIPEVSGITFGGSYLWLVSTNVGFIFSFDTTNNIYTAYDVLHIPGGTPGCSNCISALSYDNGYLWLSNNETDSIYKIDVSSLIGLIEYKEEVDVKVYPNPCRDYLIVDSPQKVSIAKVYDLSGQMVLRCDVIDNRIGLENLKGGSYIINFTIGESQLSKLIKVID